MSYKQQMTSTSVKVIWADLCISLTDYRTFIDGLKAFIDFLDWYKWYHNQ